MSGIRAPRGRHLLPDGSPRFTNRLVGARSLYLRQHAHNPVDWWPWGPEAFAEARRRGCPVLLSVGYATCHWCHVMEEESFEDLEIAALLNDHYVAIKLDREERPDLDAVYMAALQLFAGHGGWPMTLWLNHEAEPFHAASYIPARDGDRGVSMGFSTLLRVLERAWREDPRVARAAASVREALGRALRPEPGAGGLPGTAPLRAAVEAIARSYDPRWGGLRPAPKFPSSLPARLLLREDRLRGDARARSMALHSLERMAAGGLQDQLGGGFHRYSTDERWLVPHFEKMLYDNALLVLDYLEAWQASGAEGHARVARRTLGWMDEEMSEPGGGFYAATDADSLGPSGERGEGFYFTWTPQELRATLEPGQARAVEAAYGVTEEGQLEGRSVLHALDIAGAARSLGASPEALEATLAQARTRLLARRARRPVPQRDEKVLAAWNGLAIQAFARGARLAEPGRREEGGLLLRAEAAASFALTRMRSGERLHRAWAQGEAYLDATLEDHAFLVAGLLELLQASGDARWLEAALALDRQLAARFEDPAGGFFRGPSDGEALLVREKPVHDGALPSGNAVHAHSLLVLARLTGDDGYRQRADALLAALSSTLVRAPIAVTELLLALQLRHQRGAELVLVAPREQAELRPALEALAPLHSPGLLVLPVVEGPQREALAARLPLLRGRSALEGKPTAYLCEGGACQLPITGIEALVAAIEAR